MNEHLRAKLTWLLIWLAGLTFSISFSYAADPGEQARLEQEVRDAGEDLMAFCSRQDVWKYDNLRPTVLRAIAPIGTIFRPAEVPVVHLSPGSPDYRLIVGEMTYRYYLFISRKQRLAEFLAEPQDAAAPPLGAVAPAPNSEELDLGEESRQVEYELDNARASYGRACGWAWPYVNLRPMCHQPGFEAATILNPFLPVPKIRLSNASPDYAEIVASLNTWEPKIGNAKSRLDDLCGDRQAAAEAAGAVAAAGPKLKPLDEKVPPEDCRLARMFEIYQKLKPALRRWRKDQHKIEALAQPLYIAKSTLAALQAQVQGIQGQINLLALKAQNPDEDRVFIQQQIQALQNQLIALMPQIAKAQRELDVIVRQITELRADQAQLSAQSDTLMESWVHDCDLFGRLGPAAHQKALLLFNQFIVEEPRLWQLYLARGAARLQVGRHDQAMADLKRVENKLKLYDSRPKPLALVTALQGYALCKQDDPCKKRQGDSLFMEAKKLNKQSWMPFFFQGWSNLESGKYSVAKDNFQMAFQLSNKTPQAENYEAMALLLAACPTDRLRNGEKAVEYAAKACKLTKEGDWICLDTLAAAHAEAGDFDLALKWAYKAFVCAPEENKEPIRQRIFLYEQKKPYRLK